MTYTEALKVLSEELKYRISGYYDHLQAGGQCDPNEECYFDVLQKAIEALEKQIPKKPTDYKEQGISKFKVGNCACCGADVVQTMKFCNECGQAIDWSE